MEPLYKKSIQKCIDFFLVKNYFLVKNRDDYNISFD